jgi:hypothetical protein
MIPANVHLPGIAFRAIDVDWNPVRHQLTFQVRPGNVDQKLRAMYLADKLGGPFSPGLFGPVLVYTEMWSLSADTCWWYNAPCAGRYFLRLVDANVVDMATGLPAAPATPRCECGSGDHSPGPGHASYCQLRRD